MVVALSAEPYTEGLTDYLNDNRPIDLSETSLSETLKDEIRKWYFEYQRFVSLTRDELLSHKQEIEDLDRQGVLILAQLRHEWCPDNLEKYYYLSFINDNFCYVLYPDGSGKQL